MEISLAIKYGITVEELKANVSSIFNFVRGS